MGKAAPTDPNTPCVVRGCGAGVNSGDHPSWVGEGRAKSYIAATIRFCHSRLWNEGEQVASGADSLGLLFLGCCAVLPRRKTAGTEEIADLSSPAAHAGLIPTVEP